MTDADRAALAGVTREKLRQPASLTTEQKAVVGLHDGAALSPLPEKGAADLPAAMVKRPG